MGEQVLKGFQSARRCADAYYRETRPQTIRRGRWSHLRTFFLRLAQFDWIWTF